MAPKTHIEQVNKDEQYYKQIVDLANVAIVKFDKDLYITDFTGNSEMIFGYRKEEVIGQHLQKTIVPKVDSTGKNLGKLIKDMILDTKTFEYNINENIRKDGKRIWMQWYNSEIKNKKGQLQGIISIGIDITNRIDTEIALKESEERFKTLSNLTFEGILIHENGIILDCNLSLERQIGFSRDELIGKHIFEKIIPRKYQKKMKDTFDIYSTQYQAEVIHKNGTIIPVSIESRKTKLGDKTVRVAAVRNIGDLKKTIAELDKYKNHLEEIVHKRTEKLKAQSKELKMQNEILQFERNQLRTIIDNIPDLIYIKDKENRFLNANLSQISHLGMNELNEVIGKTDFDFYDNHYAKEYYADEMKILKTGLPVINREELSINKKNNQIYLQTTKVPLKDKKGNIINIVGIGRDITGKKNAENKLKEQAENLKKSNIQLHERSEKIERLNNELKNTNKKLEELNKYLNESKEELETTLDQLKNAQIHLVQSEKMASLGVLMAGIAHEINNPVNFVYAGVNSIMKDFDDIKAVVEKIATLEIQHPNNNVIEEISNLKKEHEFELAYKGISETLSDIKMGATRISEIIAGLNRFSRLETENWKKSNLHEEIDSVLILLKNKYKHHINIKKKYSENLPYVDCYSGKINQVFMNVINNAIDAIEDEKGEIIIETHSEGNFVIITVKDSGKGISEDNKLKIFDPFFTTKEIGLGMGLGLAISYSIIQEHNGQIIVNSPAGKGAEFIIKIPVSQS